MFESLRSKISPFRNSDVQEAVSTVGKGLFSAVVGQPAQTREVAQPYPYQEQQQQAVPPSYTPQVATFAAPIEQVEKNLKQEAKIKARKICAELRRRGVKMRMLFTLIVKDLDEEQKLNDYEKFNDIDGIEDLSELPEDIRVALGNKIKLETFTKLTSNIESDLLELLEDTLFQKYRLEYMSGKHEMLSEIEIMEMYTTIMYTPIYELGADMLVEKALQYKKPAVEYGKQLLDKFMKKTTSKISENTDTQPAITSLNLDKED